MDQSYKVPAGTGADEFVEKKSRFIGSLWHVTSAEEAVARINETRAAHREASHNVYAYLIREGNLLRYSDDGEPQGTAGLPVLEVLRKEGVTDVCCVVTRYFGGVLLGAGGLTRAYAKGAKVALDAAGVALMRPFRRFTLALPYDLADRVKRLLDETDCMVEKMTYGAEVLVTAFLETERMDGFCRGLADQTAGRVPVEMGEVVFRGKRTRPDPNKGGSNGR